MLSLVKKHRPNLSEIVHDEIMEMILFGELAKGVRIILNKMSERGSIY
jgi:DNA-binding GntR family transcriptional regulator